MQSQKILPFINKLKRFQKKEILSIQFQDLANRIKNSNSPFLLVDYPDLKSNKEISKISEYVLSKLNINSNGFTFNFNGFRGEPLTTGVSFGYTIDD